ncbi:hypothetical protein DFJ68_2692 [Terracoccus luteus]|jgi:hypothetical protein|uniref:YqeB PH domain-containing protein n=1 Tax=Terracoccus luteus TaxID=53356 RepID=A0A495Y458_9MICO|nr:hypothetical protein [Terracoccus luteus]RKT79228.1 hypothetical protein DFJ68_2692 [Terracoccus luteus]
MDDARTFELSPADRTFVVVGLALLGLVMTAALPTVARWTEDHGAALPGWLAAVAAWESGWTWGRPAIGAAVGVLAGGLLVGHAHRVEVSRERILVSRGRGTRRVRRIPRDRVASVHRTRRTVVVEGLDGRDLFSGTVEGDREALPAAFRRLGYPFEDR